MRPLTAAAPLNGRRSCRSKASTQSSRRVIVARLCTAFAFRSAEFGRTISCSTPRRWCCELGGASDLNPLSPGSMTVRCNSSFLTCSRCDDLRALRLFIRKTTWRLVSSPGRHRSDLFRPRVTGLGHCVKVGCMAPIPPRRLSLSAMTALLATGV